MPGGWVDVDLSVKENTIKEVKEEAGLDVTAATFPWMSCRLLRRIKIQRNRLPCALRQPGQSTGRHSLTDP